MRSSTARGTARAERLAAAEPPRGALVQVFARDAAAIDVIAAARPPLRAPKVL